MAEAITYADLRFVKAPLKKSVSSRLGQDPEADEDGELTYENVQAPPGPGAPSILASSGLGNKAGLETCTRYFLLGLAVTCLLLGVAATCLGVRFLQVSQKLQQMNRVLEATNNTLRQQLRLKITQLGQREEDLQGSRRELAQSKETLQVEQKICQTTREQLQACQSDRKTTEEALRNTEEQRMNLEQRLRSMQDSLKPFFTCSSPDTCCPVGWILNERSCFHVSVNKRSWEESQSHCKSLSSNLIKVTDISHAYGVSKTFLQSLQTDSIPVGWIIDSSPQNDSPSKTGRNSYSVCVCVCVCVCEREREREREVKLKGQPASAG
uniref:CD72 molecule n=1 Tax=Catagonus wagneri TaxID=51154 RepID=A0A8C3VTN7_9CETA